MATKSKTTEAAAPETNGKAGTKFPFTKKEFKDKAPAMITVTIAGKSYDAERKEFSTGSVGYYLNGKVTLEIGGEPVSFQIGLNLTAVGSKEAK